MLEEPLAPVPNGRWLIPLSDTSALSRLHVILHRISNLFPSFNDQSKSAVVFPDKVIRCIATASAGISAKLHLITSALPISFDATEKENLAFLSHAPVHIALKSNCSPAEKTLLNKFEQLLQLCREYGLCLSIILNDIVSEIQNKGTARTC